MPINGELPRKVRLYEQQDDRFAPETSLISGFFRESGRNTRQGVQNRRRPPTQNY